MKQIEFRMKFKQINKINILANPNIRCKTCVSMVVEDARNVCMCEANAEELDEDFTIYDEDVTVCLNWVSRDEIF